MIFFCLGSELNVIIQLISKNGKGTSGNAVYHIAACSSGKVPEGAIFTALTFDERAKHGNTSFLPPTFYHGGEEEYNRPPAELSGILLPNGRAILHFIISKHGVDGTSNAGNRAGNATREVIKFAQSGANALEIAESFRDARNVISTTCTASRRPRRPAERG